MSLLVLGPRVLFFFAVAVLSLLILYSTLRVLQFCFRVIHFRQAGVLYGPGFCVYGPLVWSLRDVRQLTIVEVMYVCFEISFPTGFGRYEARGIPKIEKPMPLHWLCEATSN